MIATRRSSQSYDPTLCSLSPVIRANTGAPAKHGERDEPDRPHDPEPRLGFYGTIDHHGDADVAWLIAMNSISDATGCADDEVRAFLDSRHGRHFAEDIANGLAAGKTIADAIEASTTRWMGWCIGAQAARETGIPHGLPYLTGFVINEGIAADADD